jgi:AraC-like DNA-binding protein
MSVNNPTVGVSAINAILQVAERFGVRREELLVMEHLQSEWVRHSEDRLPVARLFDVYKLAARLTGRDDIGLYVGRTLSFGGLNLLLYMSTICNTFRDYLNLVPSILRLRGDIGAVVVERDGEYIRLEWRPMQDQSKLQRFLSDEVLSSSQSIVNTLCIDPIPVRSAHFTYAQPDDLTQLQLTFGHDLHFEQPVSCLYFDSSSLNSPIIKLDYELYGDLTDALQDLFEQESASDPFLHTARQFIARALPTGDVAIDGLATKLGVSRRTLQRRLTERGTYFMQVLANVRGELAARYLSDNRLGVTEIAFLLGYSDQASFSTAFKGWYGVSPSEYRHR